MPGHFKVHDSLTREELDALEAFVRERPGCTVDDVHEWVGAKGYTVSRSACGTWKRQFVSRDRSFAANELARSVLSDAKAQGAIATGDASQLQIQQMVFEKAVAMQSNEEVSTKEILALALANKANIQAKQHLEKLKLEIAAALDAAEVDAKGGASGEAVVSKVREILGISTQ